jgi:flagellar basal-body rod protein FlgC
MVDFAKTIMVSASGMRAQGQRMRTIAENLANANSTPTSPGEDPYRRKVPSFQNVLDRANGVELVRVRRTVPDMSEFQKRYDPGHPGADADGYVQMPNVIALVEMMDLREAQRSYEANASVIDAVRKMLTRTIEILKS